MLIANYLHTIVISGYWREKEWQAIYEDVTRYHYIISPNLFLSFGLKDNRLSSLEIITDKNIIKERIR